MVGGRGGGGGVLSGGIFILMFKEKNINKVLYKRNSTSTSLLSLFLF